ncbi:MAG: hypothetical protein WCJ45_04820 [bacterium]
MSYTERKWYNICIFSSKYRYFGSYYRSYYTDYKTKKEEYRENSIIVFISEETKQDEQKDGITNNDSLIITITSFCPRHDQKTKHHNCIAKD